jgi:PAS domain S-box-containing protein
MSVEIRRKNKKSNGFRGLVSMDRLPVLEQSILNDSEAALLDQAERIFEAAQQSEQRFRTMIDALPAAIYTTDANGKITHFNPACVDFSGRTPTLGSDHWCVTWKLFHPDGRPMPHDECPMAISLKEGRIVRGAEAIAERPDGTRIWFAPYPTPLFDESGELIGGVNMLVDITERKTAEARIQSDADALSKLNELSSRLWNMQNLREGLDEMLAATIELLGADFGNIQILDPQRRVLLIESQRGFQKEFLHFFREVAADDESSCGRALRTGERIIVEDVDTEPDFAPMLHIVRNAGYRSVQSTPIIGRHGRPLGMISTHFRFVHRPTENELRLLDLYARQAADFIEQKQAEGLIKCQKQSLELVVGGAPLEGDGGILEFLARSMERQLDGGIVAIHLMEPDGYHFGYVVAPSLPANYARATRGMDARQELGCCSSAVVSQTSTIVADFADDLPRKRWPIFTAEMIAMGLRACFTTPIISAEKKVLGTFAIYYREPRQPSLRDHQLVDFVTGTVALAIERKQAEKALRESEQRHRQLLSLMPAAVYSCDVTGVITYYNELAAQLWGRAPQIGDTHKLFCGSDEMILPNGMPLPHEQCPMAVALREGRSFRDEEVNVRQPNGTIVPVMVNIDPIRDEHGKVIGAINAFHDVSAIRQAEKARRESEERFRMLADNMAQLAWTCDELGNVTWYNQRWLEYTGMSFEEMKDWGWTKCLHHDHVDRVVASIFNSRETGAIWEDTFPLRARDGSHRWFLSRALPIRDANGEITCWFGTNTDIEDLKQAREAAETANRVKDEFLATVSHELRTPLNAIMGWTHLLTRGKLDEETSARGLETIARNASAQNQLISDLLDISRIISGQLRFESGVVDLTSVIEAAAETVRPAADSKGIVLQLKLDRGAGLVSGDAMRLQQIVWNLLSNAIKFTPKEGQVTVRLYRENSSVVLSVSDSGEGISADFLPYIFDRFRQAESTSKRQHAGLGLGLAIVRHLVEAHGGTISALSKGVGCGATFTVTFPLLAVRRNTIDADPAFFPAGSVTFVSSSILNGLRVLVIDDEEDARELLTLALTQCGAEVRTASTVRAALQILSQWKPHALVSDIGMPGEDGYDLIRAVRALESEKGGSIPALALTGYASAEDAARTRVAGYQTHMAKPVAPSELVMAVASLVNPRD